MSRRHVHRPLLSRLSGAALSGLNAFRINRFGLAHRKDGREVYATFRTPDGRTGGYHVHARGIDWSRPVGVVFYLDGDYWIPAQSRFHSPIGRPMLRMAAIANARNLVLVAVDTPDRAYSLVGFTWWVSARENGDWLREFTQWILHRLQLDPHRIWLMGYSGGAEFITMDLLAREPRHWIRGGGAILVAGGGAEEVPAPAPDGLKDLPMTWWTGDADGSATGEKRGWSAQIAAAEGIGAYRTAGFRNLHQIMLPGVGHTGYDLPGILRASLDDVGWTA